MEENEKRESLNSSSNEEKYLFDFFSINKDNKAEEFTFSKLPSLTLPLITSLSTEGKSDKENDKERKGRSEEEENLEKDLGKGREDNKTNEEDTLYKLFPVLEKQDVLQNLSSPRSDKNQPPNDPLLSPSLHSLPKGTLNRKEILELSSLLQLDENSFLKKTSNKSSLLTLSISQLKQILKYFKEIKKKPVRLSGIKDEIASRVLQLLHSSSPLILPSSPLSSNSNNKSNNSNNNSNNSNNNSNGSVPLSWLSKKNLDVATSSHNNPPNFLQQKEKCMKVPPKNANSPQFNSHSIEFEFVVRNPRKVSSGRNHSYFHSILCLFLLIWQRLELLDLFGRKREGEGENRVLGRERKSRNYFHQFRERILVQKKHFLADPIPFHFLQVIH